MSGNDTVFIAGATGYIGGLLARDLRERGVPVRALTRSRSKAGDLEEIGCTVVEGDVLEGDGLADLIGDAPTAYYLVHSMGRGGDDDYAERDRRAATNFADAAEKAGVHRIVYLGGLAQGGSEHLKSREETGQILASGSVPVTWFRAAAVLGSGSESFLVTMYLAKRLPLMITPRWTGNKTQPVGIDDVLHYLRESPGIEAAARREIEIGTPEVLTYREMLDAAARAMDRPHPRKLTVPVLTPTISSWWLGLVTPVDVGVARPLVEGLTVTTVVKDPSGMELFDLQRTGVDDAMRAAVEGARAKGLV